MCKLSSKLEGKTEIKNIIIIILMLQYIIFHLFAGLKQNIYIIITFILYKNLAIVRAVNLIHEIP